MIPDDVQIVNAVEMRVLTHDLNALSLEDNVQEITYKIQQRGDLPHVSVEEQLNILEQLIQFPLGRFLVQNRGLNGYWTDYILMHPFRGRKTGLNSNKEPFSELEDYFLNRAPTVLATQQRFTIFRQEIQKRCREGVILASVPCGFMNELLTLDFTSLFDYRLIGVDIDEDAIKHVKNFASYRQMEDKVTVIVRDAWDFTLPLKADLITSNGLNIYVTDDRQVVQLYRKFFNNLKPGGTLVTSFLTPPPSISADSEWIIDKIDPEAGRLQRIIFVDILNALWREYRSSDLTRKQLEEAGFTEIEIIPDRARLFPTVVARRPNG